MAVLKSKEIKSMSEQERKQKLKEIKLELIKANVTANKANSKTKELKRAISRLLTFNKPSEKKGELKER